MKIAVLAPLYFPLKSHFAGGSEVWTAQFIEQSLQNKDTTIDLYAIEGSLSRPPRLTMIPLFKNGLNSIKQSSFIQELPDKEMESQKILYTMFAKALALLKENEEKYDLIIDSSGKFALSFNWSMFSKPLLVIGHNPVMSLYAHIYSALPLPPHVFFVFPSQYQWDQAKWISSQVKHTVPHGISLVDIPYQDAIGKENMVWMGRINPKSPKGLDEAIRVSKQLDKKLDIFGSIEDQAYFDREIQPSIGAGISLHKTQHLKSEIFQNSRLLIYPIQWDEPFGLVFLEAMASGTPVITYARGAASEIIKDGVTGFIVNSSDSDIRGDWIVKKTGRGGLCEAIERIYALPASEYAQMRKNCRKHVEDHFTVEKMVNQYEDLYKEILTKK